MKLTTRSQASNARSTAAICASPANRVPAVPGAALRPALHTAAASCRCMQCAATPARSMPRSSTIVGAAALTTPAPKDRISKLLSNNKQWAREQVKYDPAFFNRLRDQQTPEYLWIGCADSRVPANVIVGLDPGEVFVQRNVGNQASHTDMNVQACIEFAVKALRVKTIILCGHYKCGAVKAALTLPTKTAGLVNCWISDIREARNQRRAELQGLTEEEQLDRLCEFNVLRQVFHVCTSSPVQEAWDKGTELNVYGMCYGLDDGVLEQLVGPINSNEILGTDDQEVFVTQSLKRKREDPFETMLKYFTLAKPAAPEPVVVAAPPKRPTPADNMEALSKQLADHVAWEKGL